MKRQILLCLGVFFCAPAIANAITITAGTHYLNYNQAGQDITLTLSGAGGADTYTHSDLLATIGAGGPVVTAVFGDIGGAIPGANLAGSIWAGGGAGIANSPDGTAPTDSGQRLFAAFNTPGGAPTSANGTYAVLTLDTTGVAPGIYALSLTGFPIIVAGSNDTRLYNGLDDLLEPIPANFTLENGFLVVMPEPGSVLLGLFAVAGFAVIAAQRRRARHGG